MTDICKSCAGGVRVTRRCESCGMALDKYHPSLGDRALLWGMIVSYLAANVALWVWA